MSVDITQFHSVFFDESIEGLQKMEQVLLEYDITSPDSEAINEIFRVAHSIKGGAGTFGFISLSDFAHEVEALLDQLRLEQLNLDQNSIGSLLTSIDVMRDVLSAAQDNEEPDSAAINNAVNNIQSLLGNESTQPPEQDQSQTETEVVEDDIEPVNEPENTEQQNQLAKAWEIKFNPHIDLLQMGNDPVRMFQELALLGELSVEVNTDKLPPFFEIEPDASYLSWRLLLNGDIERSQISEIFEWVEDECELSIEPYVAEEKPVERLPEKVAEPESETIAPKKAPKKPAKKAQETVTSMRVDTDKVDALVNLVGELVITQSMLSQLSAEVEIKTLPKLNEGIEQLERHTRDMQEAIMHIRMLPISTAYNRLPRLVHDLSLSLNKKVDLRWTGEQTELDKTVLENLIDPLIHMVRNAIDHGIETPEERLAAGKPETGVLLLNAYHQGGKIIIEIQDDGAGLDADIILAKAIEKGLVSESVELEKTKVYELIFMAGFSTADSVSDISGRGVGADVVRENIQNMGGSVDVTSELGKGTTFTLRLPLTLAIMDGQTVNVAGHHYIVPLTSIIESFEARREDIEYVADKGELYLFREDYIPIIRLYDIFNHEPTMTELDQGLLVVIDAEGQKAALFVDDLISQQQVVIKSLETHYQKVMGFAGATILGDGSVSLILDMSEVITLFKKTTKTALESMGVVNYE